MSLADSKSGVGYVYIDGLAGNFSATGADSICFGTDAVSEGAFAVCIGPSAVADDTNAIAVGNGASSTSTDSIAIGQSSDASGASSVALGLSTVASANNSIAIGNTANTNGQNNCCVINASGAPMAPLPANGGLFAIPLSGYVQGGVNLPVNMPANCRVMFYNTTTNEICYCSN